MDGFYRKVFSRILLMKVIELLVNRNKEASLTDFVASEWKTWVKMHSFGVK